MKRDKCENCFYNKGGLLCQKYPPKVIADNGYISTEYPRVNNEDWCGEFLHKDHEAIGAAEIKQEMEKYGIKE